MLNIIGKIYKNKIFLVFAILILVTLPTTLYLQSDKDKTIVTSSIGIDLNNNEYEVTILAVIPKGGNDINSNLETFSSSGKSISEALDKISLDIGRKIGLAHCDSIIFSEKLMENNLTLILDYFIRTGNLSTNPTLIATTDSVKDLLDAVKSSNNLLDLSLKNIIDSQEDRTLLSNVTIDRFYRAYLSNNSTFAIPILNTKPSDDSGESSQGSGGESSNLPEDDSGGSSSGSSQEKKIKNDNDIAIVKDGKLVAKLTDDEKFIYNLLTNPTSYQKFELENISDTNFTNSTLVFQEADKIILPLCRFKDGKPVLKFKVWLSLMIDEVISNENYSYASINGIKNFITPVVENKFKEALNEKLANTIKAMQENNYDILNIYSKFNAFKYSQFQDYLNSLENPNDYISECSIEIDIKLNYVI